MAKKIDQAQVRKVAKLSRLELTEAEVEEFTGQLSAILDYVAKLNLWHIVCPSAMSSVPIA